MVTRAKRESNNRWDRDNMTILACKVKRDIADQARAAAQMANTSINAVLRQAVDSLIAGGVQQTGSNQADTGGVVLDSPELVRAVNAAADAAGMTAREWVEDVIQRELYG